MIWLEALKYSAHLSDFVSAMKSCDGQEVYRECSSGGERGASGCQTFTQPTTTFSRNNFGLHTDG